METNKYIKQEQEEVNNLKEKLNALNVKWFLETETEKKFLKFLISKKKTLINEMVKFRKDLLRFKE